VGGSASIEAVSASSSAVGAARSVRTVRALAISSHDANWALKSPGELKVRPGRKDVSKKPLRRSTMPLS
jgi:hypothetical protein